jgi:hypothetical protein
MPRLELFPFRYRDELTGKWKRARYVAERHEIEARFAEYEVLGPPEIRQVDTDARYFAPHPREGRPEIGNLGPVLTIVGWGLPRRVVIAGIAT